MSQRRPAASRSRRGAPPPSLSDLRTLPPWLVGVPLGLLLAAAGAIALGGLDLDAKDAGATTLLRMLIAEAELLGGVWLVMSSGSERTRHLAVGAFAGFAASGLVRALAGKCSCGCFGAYSVHPFPAFLLAGAAVLALLACRPSAAVPAHDPEEDPWRYLGPGLLALVIAVVGWRQPDRVRVAGTATTDGRPLKRATLVFVGDSGRVTTRTDKAGRYQLAGVIPGVYAVSAPGRAAVREPEPPKKAGRPPAKTKAKAKTKTPAKLPPGAAPSPDPRPPDSVLWVEIMDCSETDKTIKF